MLIPCACGHELIDPGYRFTGGAVRHCRNCGTLRLADGTAVVPDVLALHGALIQCLTALVDHVTIDLGVPDHEITMSNARKLLVVCQTAPNPASR